jgi:hypothetical protein
LRTDFLFSCTPCYNAGVICQKLKGKSISCDRCRISKQTCFWSATRPRGYGRGDRKGKSVRVIESSVEDEVEEIEEEMEEVEEDNIRVLRSRKAKKSVRPIFSEGSISSRRSGVEVFGLEDTKINEKMEKLEERMGDLVSKVDGLGDRLVEFGDRMGEILGEVKKWGGEFEGIKREVTLMRRDNVATLTKLLDTGDLSDREFDDLLPEDFQRMETWGENVEG